MKKPIVPIVALIAVCGAGTFLVRGCGAKPVEAAASVPTATVSREDLVITVVETGKVDAETAVELKPRVSGRIARLLVDEGDAVQEGQVVAIIDPMETELRVRQDAAQLRGAQSSVRRAQLEVQQRRVTAQADYERSQSRVAQLEAEMEAQPRLTRAAIVEAETALKNAEEARRLLVESTLPSQKTSVEREVAEARSNFQNAEADLNRQASLLEKGYVSTRTVENARLQLELAQTRLKAAQENQSRFATQSAIEVSRADQTIRQSRAALDRAKVNAIQDVTKREEYQSALADLAKARAALRDPALLEEDKRRNQASADQLAAVLSDSRRQLNETTVRAPLSGVVTKRFVQVGELATGLSSFSSGTSIFRIEDRRSMRIKLQMNEIDMARLQLGMKATIEVDAIPERTYEGRIVKIAPASRDTAAAAGQAASPDAVVRYDVEVQVVDPDPRLRTGMSAKCRIDVSRRDRALSLPSEFVIREGRKAFVELPPADPKAKEAKPQRRPVTLGLQTGARVEILEGLKEGDKVQRPKFSGPERQGFMQAGPDEE